MPNLRKQQPVHKSMLGDEWPLSVDGGYVKMSMGMALIFIHGNKHYALNGLAKNRGFEDVVVLQLDDEFSGAKKSLTPLVNLAKKLV